jgi:WD40 repeat protein/tRNA A-37 threonylcarbamoyl transferase component Bud32
MEATMNEVTNRCPECGLELNTDSPLGVCARCLLQTALPESETRASDSTCIETTGRDPEADSGTGWFADRIDQATSDPDIGRRYFGDYELLEEIASGGMGTVFRARQTRLNRIVALKMIRTGELASDTEVERFYTEAESAANLDHPGIISVYEVGEQAGQHYFSMRLIENGNLSRWIDARHLAETGDGLNQDDQNDCVRILASVARAVHFAHQRRILHRDLKPSNILLDQEGQSYVTDFGLAQRIAADSRLTASGTLVGTPSYMAPEQAAGDRGAVTTSTDVYGLGAILYEMLTGKPPFIGKTPIDTVLQVLDSQPRKPSSWCSVDRDLETVCLRCLEKDPVQRYGSAEALADDLERWLRREPIQARRTGLMERVVKWSRRRPLVASLAALLVTVATIGFLAVCWQWHETELALELAHQTAIAEATARAPVLSPRRVLAHDGAVLTSVFSPDGSRVLTASHDKTAVIWDAMTGDRIASLEGHTAVLSKAEFSSDGRLILTVSHGGISHYTYVDPVGQLMTTWRSGPYGDETVRVWEAATGKSVAVLAGHTAQVTDAGFSPDGSRVITSSHDRTARLWDVTTGNELLRLDGHEAAILSAVFSPDGRHVLTSSYGTKFEIQSHESGSHTSSSSTVNEAHIARVWDAETGRELFGLRNRYSSSRTQAVYSPDGRWIATAAEHRKNVALWDAQSGKRVASLAGHTHEVNRIRFTQDGLRLVTASSDATSRVYEVPTGNLVAVMRGHDESILDARFSADGRRVVTASGDGSVRVWESTSGKGLALLKGHEDRVYSAAFSPDGLLVTTASLDGTAAIWNSATLEQLSVSLTGHRGVVTSVEFSPDGHRALTASRDGSARIWDAANGQELLVLQGHSSLDDSDLRDRLLRDVRSATFSPDGTRVLTGTEETHATIAPFLPGPPQKLSFNPVRLFDVETGTETVRIEGLECGVQFAAFSPDGSLVVSTPDAKVRLYERTRTGMRASGSTVQDTSVRILDARTGDEIHELTGHSGVVHMATFSPDGRTLATVDKHKIRLFDVKSGRQLAQSTDQHPQNQIEFRADGRQLLSRGWNRIAYIMDTNDLSVIHQLIGHEETLTDARFSPNGRLIATASADGTVRIWNAESGKQQHILQGHRKRVLFAVFDPTSGLLATSSQDKRVRVWNANSGEELIVLEGHKGQVVAASFSPDGRWLGTASEDYTARLWPVYVAIYK